MFTSIVNPLVIAFLSLTSVLTQAFKACGERTVESLTMYPSCFDLVTLAVTWHLRLGENLYDQPQPIVLSQKKKKKKKPQPIVIREIKYVIS